MTEDSEIVPTRDWLTPPEASVGGAKVPGGEFLRPDSSVVNGHRPPGVSRLGSATRFGAVGLTGLVVNQLLFWLFVGGLGLHYSIGAVLATQGSTTWNFILADQWVFAGHNARSRLTRFLSFAGVNNALLLLRLPLLTLFISGLGVGELTSNLATLVLLFVVRFAVSDRFIWKAAERVPGREPLQEWVEGNGSHPNTEGNGSHPNTEGNGSHPNTEDSLGSPSTLGPKVVVDLVSWREARGPDRASGSRSSPAFEHTYSLGRFVSIGSDIRLKELEYFRTTNGGGDLDIEIRTGSVGRRRPRARALIHQAPGYVAYEEHLGRVGANFRLDIGDRIRVTIGPLLARSPHVVYTNVVEALLRFVLISRGRILLHSATVVLDGRGVMLSARTDTGKTGTVLRLLQEHQGEFLSDDMTIVDSTGMAYCYPKPLTISAHTLRAVNRNRLNRRERIALSFQSRIHSRGGRSMAQRLADMNVPIMAVNALTQALVPPPKYMITRLIGCEIVASTQIRDLFLIERGPSLLEAVDPQRAIEMMIENTDDAYGFPPFRYFAPAIAIGGDDYITLRRKEHAIVTSALNNVVIRRIACEDFSWADTIPAVLGTTDVVTEHSTAFGRERIRSATGGSQASSVEKWGVIPGNAPLQ